MSPESSGYTGEANLAQGDRVASVTVGIQVVESLDGGTHQWRGWYKGADLDSEPEAGDAQITLDSGGSGSLTVTRALTGTGEGTFTGIGEPPPFD